MAIKEVTGQSAMCPREKGETRYTQTATQVVMKRESETERQSERDRRREIDGERHTLRLLSVPFASQNDVWTGSETSEGA